MDDTIKNSDYLRKLGFLDSSSQWLLYDDRFEKFFDFLAQNITEENILSDEDVFEFNQLKLAEPDIEDDILSKSMQLTQEELDILHEIETCDAAKVAALTEEIKKLRQIEKDAIEMVDMARDYKNKANTRLNELDDELLELEVRDSELLNNCQMKAKQLEEIQIENKHTNKETQNRFLMLSPPTLFHLLPLEDYYTKIDACNHYLTLYLQNNYKILENQNHDQQSDDARELMLKMHNLKKLTAKLTLKLYAERNLIKTAYDMIDEIESYQIDVFDIHDIERKTHELAILNEHHLKVANEKLQNELKACVQDVAQQRVELVLMDNTKMKLERALKRRQNEKNLENLIKNMLLNAEIIWVAMQLDIERVFNRVDVQKRQATESRTCLQRIRRMQDVNAQAEHKNVKQMILEMMAKLLSNVSDKHRVCSATKDCLNENENFNRQLALALQNLLNGRPYKEAKKKIQNIVNLEKHLRALLFDSPIEAPLLYGIKHLHSLFMADEILDRSTDDLHSLRLHFQTEFQEKMESNSVFRENQLLWINFIEEPERVLKAIDDVRRIASTKTMTSVRVLSGIKRKQ